MKHPFTGFSLIGAFALLALAVGCGSTQTQNKENLLIAAEMNQEASMDLGAWGGWGVRGGMGRR